MTCLNYLFLDFSRIRNIRPILKLILKRKFFLVNWTPDLRVKFFRVPRVRL